MANVKSKIEDIIIEELFETAVSASAAVIAVKLAKRIAEIPEIKDGLEMQGIA